MTNVSDALIDQLAHQETPRAYGHEVKAMAQEIQTYRKQAAAGTNAATGVPYQTSIPWPYAP